MTENYSSPKYPLDESIFAAKYATYQEIVQILKNWAHKNCFGLVIDKHDKDKRVYLRCKRGGDTRIRVVNEDRQRSKNTIRVQCPYIIKIVYSKKAAENEKWRLCKQDEDLNEDKHNHPLDMDQALVLPLAKRSLLGSETIAIVQHQMIDAGNTVPEIRKTISGTDGETIMNYHDIRNWKVEVQAHDKLKPRDVDSDVFKFIKSIEEKGYIVRYQTSTDGKHLQSIFFMHCTAVDEVNIRGEVFAIDATYKVNELEMPLVSIQSVSHLGRKSLMTTPIAYAIVSNESSSTYAWILNNIKEIAPNGNTNVFITDKHSGVMKGLSAVHPDKVHLLCTWHMLESVKVALKGLFISSRSTHACMKAVSDMIDSSTEEDFQSALDAYQNEATDVKKLTEKNKVMQQNGKIVQKYLAQEYLSDYWLVIKKKWAGYIVKKTVNFGCNTTQRVEGSHASLKMNAVSSRSTLPNLFNEIDKYIKKQIMRQTNAMRDEKIKVDCFIQGNSSMSLLTGKISSWALDRIYQELLKTVAEDEEPFLPVEKCFDCEIKSFNLPCKHEVAHPASKLHGKIRLEIVGRRWLLKQEPQVDGIPQNSSMERIMHMDTAYQRKEEDDAAMFSSAMAKLQLLFRKCETTSEVFSLCQELNNVGEKIEKAMQESRNTSFEFPEHSQVSRIGRPSKERVYLAYRADANKKRKKIEDEADGFRLPKRKISKLEEKLTTKKNRILFS